MREERKGLPKAIIYVASFPLLRRGAGHLPCTREPSLQYYFSKIKYGYWSTATGWVPGIGWVRPRARVWAVIQISPAPLSPF